MSLTRVTRTFAGHGHRFAIRSDDETILEAIDDVFVDLVADAEPRATYDIRWEGVAGDGWVVTCGEEYVGASPMLPYVLTLLLWHVNRASVAAGVVDRVVLHASCVARDGVGVILAAPMESGKTTMAAGLLGAGFSYLTDEAVGIDPQTLRLRAYPKPLSIDIGSQPVLSHLMPADPVLRTGQWQVPGSRASGRVPVDDIAAAVVISPRYREGAPTRIEPVGRAQMLIELAASTFEFAAAPLRNLDVTAAVLRGCDSYRLVVGDLAEAVDCGEPGRHPAERFMTGEATTPSAGARLAARRPLRRRGPA